MRSLDALLAIGAIKVVENNTGAVVTLLNLAKNAINVEDMPAFELQTWHLTHACYVAN